MNRTLATLVIVVAALIALVPAQPQFALAFTIELRPGESQSVGDDGLVVGFNSIFGDSRCPTGLLCIWGGDATAQIWPDHPSLEKTTALLHTHYDFQKEFTYADNKVTLTKVTPYPVYGEIIDPDDYRVVVTVLVGKSSPTRNATWSRIKALYN